MLANFMDRRINDAAENADNGMVNDNDEGDEGEQMLSVSPRNLNSTKQIRTKGISTWERIIQQ